MPHLHAEAEAPGELHAAAQRTALKLHPRVEEGEGHHRLHLHAEGGDALLGLEGGGKEQEQGQEQEEAQAQGQEQEQGQEDGQGQRQGQEQERKAAGSKRPKAGSQRLEAGGWKLGA